MSASESPWGDPLLPDRDSPSGSSGFVSAILEERHHDHHLLTDESASAETSYSLRAVSNSRPESQSYRVESLFPTTSMDNASAFERVTSASPAAFEGDEDEDEDAATAAFTSLLPALGGQAVAAPVQEKAPAYENAPAKPASRTTKTYAMLLEDFLASAEEERTSTVEEGKEEEWMSPEISEKEAKPLAAPLRSETIHFPVEPLFFRGDNVSDLLGLLAADVRKVTCTNESFFVPPAPTEPEPVHLRFSARFDMPRRFRCNFCHKYDSICSHCHIKWTQLQTNHRRFLVAEIYGKLSQRKRCSLSFLTAMCGNASFSKMQSFNDRGEFTAMRVDFREKVPRLRSLFRRTLSGLPFVEEALPQMGGVTQLHVGIGFENPTLVEYWFSPSFAPELAWRNSTLGFDPLEAVRRQPLSPSILAALDRSAEVQKHLLFARGRQLLCRKNLPGGADSAELCFADLMVLDEEDPRGPYGKAVLRFVQGRYKQCLDLCELGQELCGKRAQECENFSLQERFKELLRKARAQVVPQSPSTSRSPKVRTPPPAPQPSTTATVDRSSLFFLTRTLNLITPFCSPLALTTLDHALAFSFESFAGKKGEKKGPPLLLHTRFLTALTRLPPEALTAHLKARPHYDDLAEEMIRRGPTEFLTSPLHLLHILVMGVEDFYAFHVKVYLIGVVNHQAPDIKKVLHSKGIAKDAREVVVTKHFFICRAREQDTWLISDIKKEKHSKGSERKDTHKWHLDVGLTTSLGSYLKKNTKSAT